MLQGVRSREPLVSSDMSSRRLLPSQLFQFGLLHVLLQTSAATETGEDISEGDELFRLDNRSVLKL